MKHKYRKLEELYKKIPKIDCQGKCYNTCGIVPASKIEIKRARERIIKNPFSPIQVVMKQKIIKKSATCAALCDKRCSIYMIRPAICRLYGVAEGLECKFGCKPDKIMTKDEAYDLIREIEAL
ncbi:hypothetical protein [Pedobacter sp.]|jgi:Fe-S-cluster containining protein|uniref:hypothetical protein n=1 Tax=Pedobacter sp. TaxID=1411316 RepID=UPI002BC8AFA6|nr:hypothetical protein [Pedobacter sp.]HWW39860.1 hypothetical protein [Pedobacter sp.]